MSTNKRISQNEILHLNAMLHEITFQAIGNAKNKKQLSQIENICDEYLYVFPEQQYSVIHESIMKLSTFNYLN